VSGLTTAFLDWCCEGLVAREVMVLVLIWDNASRHLSHPVRRWLRCHNQKVKQDRAGVRILSCILQVKSPWLDRIEPSWVHGKRRVTEPARLLSAADLAQRVCSAFNVPRFEQLTITNDVA